MQHFLVFLIVIDFSEAVDHWPLLLATSIVKAARAIPFAHAHATADFLMSLVRVRTFENVVEKALIEWRGLRGLCLENISVAFVPDQRLKSLGRAWADSARSRGIFDLSWPGPEEFLARVGPVRENSEIESDWPERISRPSRPGPRKFFPNPL